MVRFTFRYIFLFIFFTHFHAHAQIKKIGIPFITNYTPKAYHAASENWDVLQDSRGMLFFGNHFGLLQFDGVHWQIVMQPDNKSMVRSMAQDKNGRIYIGAQGDFGYILLQPNGKYYYTSLLNLVDKQHRSFGDVWHTVLYNNAVIFYTRDGIYIYKENKITIILPQTLFDEFYEMDHSIYILDKNKGLLTLTENNTLVAVSGGEKLAGMKLRNIFGHKDNLLLLTQSDGFFLYAQQKIIPWKTEADYLLKENQVSTAIVYSGGFYAIGTRQNGLIVIDSTGHLMQHISKQTGLQNDYITNLKEDRDGNLWLTLKDGIDFVEMASPLSHIEDNTIAETKIYCSLIYQNKLYVGTDNGVFWIDWQAYKQHKDRNVHFEKVTGIVENVWSLSVHDKALLAFEEHGTYQIEGNTARNISSTGGTWKAIDIPNNPATIIVGGYMGLYLYKKNKQQWQLQQKIKGFDETSRVFEMDKIGNIWVAHGYKGVYKIKLNEALDSVANIRFYDKKDGFPSSLFLTAFSVNEKILFGTMQGVYILNDAKDNMVTDTLFKKYFGDDKHIRLLQPDNKNNVWFIASDNTGVIHQFKDGSFHVEELAFRKMSKLYVPGFENIQTSDSSDIFFGTQNGLIHYNNNSNKNYQSNFASVISSVSCIVPKDSSLFSNLHNPDIKQGDPDFTEHLPLLPYAYNSLRFSFAALYYENTEAIQYQHWLEGFEKDWSPWNTLTEKEYTNLPEGKYIFHTRAKNLYDVVSAEATYRIQILPPWYRSKWAYLAYLLLFVLFIYSIIRYQKNIARRERNQLIENQQKELLLQQAELKEQKLLAEQEKMEIVNQKLASDIKLKNAKVASNTVNLIHLNEILLSIKEHVNQAEKNTDPKANHALLSKINRIIDYELQGDQHWEEFEEIFNQLHDNFIQRLKISFAELTPRDVRLCAYLRMNLSTKEIAPLLGISVRGIEDTRYRIRKKLHLSAEANLTEFILNF